MNIQKPHISASASDVSEKITSIRALILQAKASLDKVDEEIVETREEINRVATAPVSRQEFCDYAMRSMKDQAAAWQKRADEAILKASSAGLIVPITVPSHFNGKGKLFFRDKEGNTPTCPLSPNVYGGTATSLNDTAFDPNTVTPAVAWLAVLGEPFENAVSDWIMQRAEAVGIPEKAEYELSERTALLERLRSKLESAIETRETLITEIGELSFSMNVPLPRLPTDPVPQPVDYLKRTDGVPFVDRGPTVKMKTESGEWVLVGPDRWRVPDSPPSDALTWRIDKSSTADNPVTRTGSAEEFDEWLKNEQKLNDEAAQMASEGKLF